MKTKCKHDGGSTPSYDYVTCKKCRMIQTDGGWGIASRKWFKSVDEAKFYQRTGKRPD